MQSDSIYPKQQKLVADKFSIQDASMNPRTTGSLILVIALVVAACFFLNKLISPPVLVQAPTQIGLQFTRPHEGEQLVCRVGNDGGIIEVAGKSHGIDDTRTLLLFIYPKDPGVFGWFLQVQPHGVDLRPDGVWTALGQVGNSDYPPRQRMKIDLMVRAVPSAKAKQLIEDRLGNKILRSTAIPTQNLPPVPPECIVELRGVELETM